MPASTSEKPVSVSRFQEKGFRFLGLTFQDVIRYFFGGNASLAIVALLLICVFLIREAWLFFPTHRHDLAIFRQTGVEYVDLMLQEGIAHKEAYTLLNQAYLAELNEPSQSVAAILLAHQQVALEVSKANQRTVDDWKKADDAGKVALRTRWVEGAEKSLEQTKTWNVEVAHFEWTDDLRQKMRQAVLEEGPGGDEKSPFIAELEERKAQIFAETSERLKPFNAIKLAFRNAGRPLDALTDELAKIAKENRELASTFSSAPERKEALLEGAAMETDPVIKARKVAEAEAIVMVAPDYASLTRPFYDSVPKHDEVNTALRSDLAGILATFPEPGTLQTELGRKNLRLAHKSTEQLLGKLKLAAADVKAWRHDAKVGFGAAVTSFFFGKRWITNSSWQDFYGVLPLFSGSLIIALIAMVVAVPFSIASAIYVNQLASFKEQSFVKPTIEFIGAIPSVVLGFFGIMVLGTTLRDVSQLEWLSWVPGFPMQERLTMLNAGLLLAFMAIPTIFTLAEDAINNVPHAFTESSFALGATKLQTVFRVILPTALSGIIAAILLGFGRIIGETMVVLLVAGNKIQIPDFNAGLGVIAQPAHTMTGIIAQELGEVERGSLHWRALFMVGMVLFVISLIINYIAQWVVKRFHKV